MKNDPFAYIFQGFCEGGDRNLVWGSLLKGFFPGGGMINFLAGGGTLPHSPYSIAL